MLAWPFSDIRGFNDTAAPAGPIVNRAASPM